MELRWGGVCGCSRTADNQKSGKYSGSVCRSGVRLACGDGYECLQAQHVVLARVVLRGRRLLRHRGFSRREPSKMADIRVHHATDSLDTCHLLGRAFVVDNGPVVPPVALRVPGGGDGWRRHGVLVEGSATAATARICRLNPHVLAKPDRRGVRSGLVGLGFHGLVDFLCPRTRTVTRGCRAGSNVEARQTPVKTHIPVGRASAVVRHSVDRVHHGLRVGNLGIDHHRRRIASERRRWPMRQRVKGLNARQADSVGLRSGVGDGRRARDGGLYLRRRDDLAQATAGVGRIEVARVRVPRPATPRFIGRTGQGVPTREDGRGRRG